MLELAALAANSVVAAATADTSDAWEAAKRWLARLDNPDLDKTVLGQWLDETRQQLAETDSSDAREAQARLWEVRLAEMLEYDRDLEGDLRALVEEIQRAERMSGPGNSVVAGGDVSIFADRSGIAAGVIHGNVGPIWQSTSTAPIASPHPGSEFSDRKAKLFISYAHRDDRYREQLVTHLAGLRRQGVIADWHDRKIVPGQEWRDAIDKSLDAADCVLLLVSSDFLASDYCYSIEMQRTLKKHREGQVVVIPVIVRPADWQHTPLAGLQALPKDAKPVVEWSRRDRAWLSVTEGIRRALVPSARD